MVSILATEANIFRAFGWVQDPSNLRSLCNVVAVFDPTSEVHRILKEEILPNLVLREDGRDELISILNQRPLMIEYSKLVGMTTLPRSESRCNAIIQAAVKGQMRDFIGDWPADNFVRWAHAFGFISYDYGSDSFQITEEGKRLVKARPKTICYPSNSKDEKLSGEEISVLTDAILAYPPAVRMLSLLAIEDGKHLTKFEIGRELGFVGEDGFTSLPQKILLHSLAGTSDHKERAKMRMDWDGSSDKYARMIGKWLVKLGLLEQRPKYFQVSSGIAQKEEMIGQAFLITAKGYMALSRARGNSKHKPIAKNVCYEMFSVKGNDREFLRLRRSYILKYFMDLSKVATAEEIRNYLLSVSIDATTDTIEDDISGLTQIGLFIRKQNDTFYFEDNVKDFTIPISKKLVQRTDQEEKKERLRSVLRHVPHEYLSLLDLAYDSKQNRLFEMKVMQLLTDVCGFLGSHLGGSRKPDGIVYINEEYNEPYGVLIDTKAYSKGYSLPIAQADEMERYIGENQTRDCRVNANEWWSEFPEEISQFYYLFISGHFKGNYEKQLRRIYHNKQIHGAVISVENLLLLAENIKNGQIAIEIIGKRLFCDKEIDLMG